MDMKRKKMNARIIRQQERLKTGIQQKWYTEQWKQKQQEQFRTYIMYYNDNKGKSTKQSQVYRLWGAVGERANGFLLK